MATFTKFHTFVDAVMEGSHTFATDQLTVALTNTAPTAATDDMLADITEIAYTNCSARTITTISSTQTSGTYSLVVEDLTLTASGGAIAQFRYVVVYNDTATNDELVCYYDYGSAVDVADGETFKIDFGSSLFTLA